MHVIDVNHTRVQLQDFSLSKKATNCPTGTFPFPLGVSIVALFPFFSFSCFLNNNGSTNFPPLLLTLAPDAADETELTLLRLSIDPNLSVDFDLSFKGWIEAWGAATLVLLEVPNAYVD